MKKVIFLVLALCLITSLAGAAKRDDVSRTAIRPATESIKTVATITAPRADNTAHQISQSVQSATVTTELPVDAINLLYYEGYLTKEERDILLYTDYSTLLDGEKGPLWSALRALWCKIANAPGVKTTVREAFHAIVYYTLEQCDGGGSSGYSPCPGSPYDPYMEH